ncbi:hypothetical protein HHL14_26170 [Paraburkholderia sp. G-4-1-8]|uniref:Uncharacterized protein n=1 Tax=Paraburkholderia antibiotica TaxID=2728839 RepID=A0A7Y0A0M9_9BURK|nr:hypothetical protein [Paraburkholderia antibiotica]
MLDHLFSDGIGVTKLPAPPCRNGLFRLTQCGRPANPQRDFSCFSEKGNAIENDPSHRAPIFQEWILSETSHFEKMRIHKNRNTNHKNPASNVPLQTLLAKNRNSRSGKLNF